MSKEDERKSSSRKKKKADKESKKAEKKADKASKKSSRRSSSSGSDTSELKEKTEKSKETQQRNKLRLIAKMMKGNKSPERIDGETNDSSLEFSPIKNKLPILESFDMLGREIALSKAVDKRHDDMFEKSFSDTSQTTNTTTDMDGTFHSCRSRYSDRYFSDDASSVSGSSVSSFRSTVSRKSITSFPLQAMNTWESVKQIDGYADDLAECLLCHMIRLCPDRNIRQDVGIRSFRSAAFRDLARCLVNTVDLLVSMMAPDSDDTELLDVSIDLEERGIHPKLFCQALTFAVHELLGDEEFPKAARDAWDQAFGSLYSRMAA